MHFVFWQNLISPHQAPFLRELATLGHEVLVVAPEEMEEARRQLGWQVPDLGAAKVVIHPTDAEVTRIIVEGPDDAIHIMAGARWLPLGELATSLCLKLHRRIGVLTEAPDPRGLVGCARWLKYAREYWMRGRRYEFLLAMGEMGVKWFHGCGYDMAQLYPFCYITEPAPEFATQASGGKVTVLFVGRLVALKGIEVLLRALKAQPYPDVELHIVGDGPEEESLQSLAAELGVADRVEWVGRLVGQNIAERMAMADILVLPSHKDGWGAVVNESLMVGTPVICSTACGAADLIREPWLGTVFKKGNVKELAAALGQWIGRGRRKPEERLRIREWSRCIEGKSVAQYFSSVISHTYNGSPRPSAPWRLQTSPDN